jgi:6-phosphogluconolactonase
VSPQVILQPDAPAIFRAAAEEFVRAALAAVQAQGRFTVALAGGSTPKGLYSLLATDPDLRARLPWGQIHFFFGDERHVPPNHADSNYRMAREAMLSKAPIAESQVFRIQSELPHASEAARLYEEQLRQFFQLTPGALPRFDLVLLGMGPDGHTASLFPGTHALAETERLVVCNWVGKFYTHRITMTAPVLSHAAMVMFMAAGADKAPALKAVLEGPHEPQQLPAQLIRPGNGRLLWLVDRQAAQMLAHTSSKSAS